MIETSPMTKIFGLGLGAALLLLLMYLFTVSKVADTGASRTGKSIDSILGPNLDASRPTKVTMSRDGTGVDPPRTYVVRLHPAAALLADAKALPRLCEKARDLVFEEVASLESAVTVHCVVEDGPGLHVAWRRLGGDEEFRILSLDPPPDLPAVRAEDGEEAE